MGSYWSDDTIVKLINHTAEEWEVSAISGDSGWCVTKLSPGNGSGWNPGIPLRSFSDTTQFSLRWRKGFRPDGIPPLHHYALDVKNPDIGEPTASLYTWDGSGDHVHIVKESMGKGELISMTYQGHEFFLQRWGDGDETIEGRTTEYCRFILRVIHS